MEVTDQPNLRFEGVDFVEVSFKSQNFYKGEKNIDIHIEPKLAIDKKNPNAFQIIMNVELSCKDVFDLNLVGIGYFLLESENLDEKMRNSFLNVNAPAIMFPYVRSFISTLTSNLGNITGALTIPPQFFKSTLEKVEN